jgi:hypothetical protein
MKTVYVAIYEHPDRTDVRVFQKEDDVWAWQQNWPRTPGSKRSTKLRLPMRISDRNTSFG